ncbi:UMP-CMP kinase 3-like isoform X2 [Wolffia australiana]
MWRRSALSFSSVSLPAKTVVVSLFEMSCGLQSVERFTSGVGNLREGSDSSSSKKPVIAFVLGGPGSGKGTQCSRISQIFGFAHFSAGDLLRKEILSNSENGLLISNIIKNGQIVPSEITVRLIQREIESASTNRVLIDGFPRSEENRIEFERIVGVEPDLVLYFNCPEEEMVKRVLSRNQGRSDDNVETLKKRFKTFTELNLPVINYYRAKNKVCEINAVGTEEQVFEKLRSVFDDLRRCQRRWEFVCRIKNGMFFLPRTKNRPVLRQKG